LSFQRVTLIGARGFSRWRVNFYERAGASKARGGDVEMREVFRRAAEFLVKRALTSAR
jgi:hypothetical protein